MYHNLKIAVSVVLISLFSLSSFSQKVVLKAFIINKPPITGDTIYYSNNNHLSWKDFTGKPDLKSFAGAVTASGFAYNANISGDADLINIKVYIYTFFVKSHSWRKPSVTEDYYLQHEQHHFDISRLGAQEFSARLSKSKFNADNYQAQLDSIFNKTFNDYVALQERYDRETNHSIQKQMQLAWNQTIEKEVKELE